MWRTDGKGPTAVPQHQQQRCCWLSTAEDSPAGEILSQSQDIPNKSAENQALWWRNLQTICHSTDHIPGRWIDTAGKKTYKDLVDLLLLEQFMSSVTQETATFIKERVPKTVEEAGELVQIDLQGGTP